ncbi:MAG: hypothetical protein ACLQOO_23815 [Terriglobia bacterium]
MKCSKSLPLALVALICFTGIDSLAGEKDKDTRSLDVQTPYGKFLLNDLKFRHFTFGEEYLSGTVTNSTDRAWGYVTFRLRLVDKKGQPLPVPVEYGHPPHFGVSDLAVGQTKAITDPLDQSTRGATIVYGNSHAHDFDLIEFDPTGSEYKFEYVFKLTKPRESDATVFEDEVIRIDFALSDLQDNQKPILFELHNKTQEPLTISWDQCSYVDGTSRSHRVIHEGIKLEEREKPQAPTIVPPGSTIQDSFYPSDSITLIGPDVGWMYRPFLPRESPEAQKGKTISLFMPVEIQKQQRNYLFAFTITDVQIKKE